MTAERDGLGMTGEEIFAYWKQQAREHAVSYAASWSDRYAIELEIKETISRVGDGERVLDIGCANGFSTLRIAAARRISIRGIDYVPEMIEQARRALEGVSDRLESDVEFEVGDITGLREDSDSYDKVIVTRVIINIGDWERQRLALEEALRVVKPGGILLLSEACLQTWRSLNRFRGEWGLEPIPMPEFNNYLDRDRVAEAVAPKADLVEISNFASSYYVGTRLLKPLLAGATEAPVDPADPETDWNRWWSQVPAVGDYGTQVLFVFRKNAQ
jgi:ubiquinone/menaquinone biosynthesis C-methylase UbiE